MGPSTYNTALTGYPNTYNTALLDIPAPTTPLILDIPLCITPLILDILTPTTLDIPPSQGCPLQQSSSSSTQSCLRTRCSKGISLLENNLSSKTDFFQQELQLPKENTS